MASRTNNNLIVARDIMSQLVRVVRATSDFNASASLAILIPSIFSAVAVFFIICHIGTAAGAQLYRRFAQGAKGERIFVTTPLGIYIISLLFSSLLSAIGASVNIQWVKARTIEAGSLCGTQATLLQFGNLGTAFFILYISAHTFNVVVLRKAVARWVLALSVVSLWALVLFLDLAGPLLVPKDPFNAFYGPAGSWCWITTPYVKSQKSLQAVPMIIVSGLSIILFGFILARARQGGPNHITGQGKKAMKLTGSSDLKGSSAMLVTKYLVWYPVVYILFTLPLSVVALMGRASSIGKAVVFAEVLYSFQGLAFVAVFICTYRVFGGRPWRIGVGSYTLQGSNGKASDQSFEALEKAISPVSPPQPWKPATKEWAVDRSMSTRSRPYSMMSAVSKASSGAPLPPIPSEMPVPPVPVATTEDGSIGRARSHRRNQSEDTLVDREDVVARSNTVRSAAPYRSGTIARPAARPEPLQFDEQARDSNGSLDTIVEVPTPEPSPPQVPSRNASFANASVRSATPPIDSMARQRSLAARQQPPPSALSKKPSQAGTKFARKESVRFAPVPTVMGESPVEPTPAPAPIVPLSLPAPPPAAATAESTVIKAPSLRKPVRPVGLTGSNVDMRNIPLPPIPPAAAARKEPPKPKIVIPGRKDSNERDTVFIMETPVQLKNRPLTEFEMPVQVLEVLGRPGGELAAGEETPAEFYEDSDRASSILNYYEASSPGGYARVSPVAGNERVPRVNVQPSSEDGDHPSPPGATRAPGMLVVPPPMVRKPRPGYV